MYEMCVTVIYFLLVKLIKFFLFSLPFYILLPVMVNKDFHNKTRKKISYREQTARQHSCHRIFWPGSGVFCLVKIFLSSSLFTMQI